MRCCDLYFDGVHVVSNSVDQLHYCKSKSVISEFIGLSRQRAFEFLFSKTRMRPFTATAVTELCIGHHDIITANYGFVLQLLQ